MELRLGRQKRFYIAEFSVFYSEAGIYTANLIVINESGIDSKIAKIVVFPVLITGIENNLTYSSQSIL